MAILGKVKMIDSYEILEKLEKREKLFSYDDLKQKLGRLQLNADKDVQSLYINALKKNIEREIAEAKAKIAEKNLDNKASDVEKKTEQPVAEQKSDFSSLIELKRKAESTGTLRLPKFKYDFDVFISHRSYDIELAKKVYAKLVDAGYRPFLSEIEIAELHSSDYATIISEVLSNVQNMIVVGSCCKNIDSGWVRFEWNAFANELHSGRKKGNLITVLSNGAKCNRDEIPFLLRQYEILGEEDLDRLTSFILKKSNT